MGMYLLFLLLPKIDPMKENIERFRRYYNLFILVIIGFLFYVFILTIIWNLGYSFNIVQLLVPAFGILSYFVGILFEKTKRNWFIGIRTPWTLSSDKVWDKTHKLGSKLFKFAAALSLFGLVFSKVAFYLIIFPLILISIFLLIYSYFEYKKTQDHK